MGPCGGSLVRMIGPESCISPARPSNSRSNMAFPLAEQALDSCASRKAFATLTSSPGRADERPDDSAHGLDLARRPAGLGEEGAQRVARRLGTRRRVAIAFAHQLLVQLA